LNDEQAIVATTDFFMPIVDDPFDFGRIAATQRDLRRVRDGGHAVVSRSHSSACDQTSLPMEIIRGILAGGESVSAAAGIPIAGRPQHRLGGTDLRAGG
jgi:selenide,water dikinase